MTPFTPGELAVMRLLWEHGEMKPSEMEARFPGPIKNPALRSYLTILVDKGHVSRRRVGKAFYYRPITRQTSAFRRTLRQLVDAYCGGSTEALLLTLIRAEKLTAGELLELQRLAQDDESTEPSKDKPTAKDAKKPKSPPKKRGRRR